VSAFWGESNGYWAYLKVIRRLLPIRMPAVLVASVEFGLELRGGDYTNPGLWLLRPEFGLKLRGGDYTNPGLWLLRLEFGL